MPPGAILSRLLIGWQLSEGAYLRNSYTASTIHEEETLVGYLMQNYAAIPNLRLDLL
jgi:hypothetical protein